MILSDRDIKKAIKERRLRFRPALDEDQIGPSSIDLRLSRDFKLFKADKMSLLDIKQEVPPHFMENKRLKKGESLILHPHTFVLASTVEYIYMPDNLVVRVEGKSSLARMGIMVHTAGFVDPGFEGTITLEISNQANIPVAIYPEMYICQIAVEPLTSAAEVPYNKRKKSLYAGSRGPKEASTKNLFKEK